MKIKEFRSRGLALVLALFAASACQADVDVTALQQRLEAMEKEMAALRAELARLAAQEPKQQQQVAAIESKVAVIETRAPAAKIAGNRVFFRGGATGLMENRADQAFTDLHGLLGADSRNTGDTGWYFGAGFDFLLSRDTLGLLPGTWLLAELGLEFRNLGDQETLMTGPAVGCLALGYAAATCTTLVGREEMTMLTVSASPKLKFREGAKLRPWIIPAGFDINVISPPSDSTNYLDVGVQFAAGVDYEVFPGITLGLDARYHLAANLTDPKYSDAQAAAVAALPGNTLNLNTDPDNDTWTAGASLGIAF